MKAWLVTWEGTEESKREEKRIAAILSPRLSADRVRRIVEMLYANTEFSLGERVSYAAGKFNPFPARYVSMRGIPFEGKITCGHNPYLDARKVANLTVTTDELGNEHLSWDELPLPVIGTEKRVLPGR
ncbi:MAG TPA: hypothetical protein VEY08_09790 [Chloroflexia bacterium]|nr:hypothetical protein [Chloroflexia bacterium]